MRESLVADKNKPHNINVCATAWWVHLKVFYLWITTVTDDSLKVLIPAADVYIDVVRKVTDQITMKVKFEKNWRFKSIESLEKKSFAAVSTDESSIVQRLSRLRKVPINEFQIDDIRFMIIQGIGLKFLIPEAIDLLKENLLTESNYYEGDLLNSILLLNEEQWRQVGEHWDTIDSLIKDRLEFLRTMEPKLKIDNFYNCKPK